MKLHAKSVLATAATVAVTAGTLIMGASAASASVTVPWEPDAYSTGSVTLYNAAGVPVTGGNLSDSPMFTYAVASGTTTDTGVAAKAKVAIYTPDGTTHTYNYVGAALNAYSTYPVASGPANITSLGATTPVSTMNTTSTTLQQYIGAFPNTQAAPYTGLYQLRLQTPSGASAVPSPTYFSVDIQVTGTTWAVVYPVPATATSVAAITPTPVSPADHGSTVTLSTTISAGDATHQAGTVAWFDGATALTGGTFNSATGAASIVLNPADGAHSYTAVFTPTNNVRTSPTATYYLGSTSAALPFTVNPVSSVTVGLSVNPSSGPAYTSTTLTATVTPSISGTPAGTMAFYDNGAQIGSSSTGVANVYTYTQAAGFAAGAHSFTATFTPSNTNAWGPAATSAAVPVTYAPPACTSCTDNQNLQVTVDPGTLIISTPYFPATTGAAGNPFNLGHMILSADGTHLSATAPFGSGAGIGANRVAAATAAGATSLTMQAVVGYTVGQLVQIPGFPTGSPAVPDGTIITSVNTTTNVITLSNATAVALGAGQELDGLGNGGVTIVSTKNGDPGWTASVVSTPFSYLTNTINPANLSFSGLTPVYLTGNSISTTNPVTVTNITSGAGVSPHIGGYAPTDVSNDGLAAVKPFASMGTNGNGTVMIDGTMTLVAPTSTVSGTYSATVTFTIA